MTCRSARGIPASWVAIAALFAMVALPRPAIPLIDGDVYWHIRAGSEVLASGRVPAQDTWSIVGDGLRWVSQDWLSNVVLALGYQAGELGPTILSITWALLVVIALALLWWAYGLRHPAAGWLGRILWLAGGLIVAGPTLGVRVQVVDLPLAATVLVCCWGFLARPRWEWLAPLPIIALAWANLHAGWPLIYLIGGAVLVGEAGDRLLRRRPPETILSWRHLRWLALALVVSVLPIALNPNGLALYTYPLETSSIAAHRDFISEWRPPDPGTFIGQVFIGFVLLVVLPSLWAGRRGIRLADLFLIVGMTVMIAVGARFLLLAPIVAVAAGLSLEPAASESPRLQRFRRPLARLAATRRGGLFTAVNGLLITVLVVAGLAITWARVGPTAQADMVAEHMPVAAVDWILENDPGSRPFNQYSWGGYLGLRQPAEPIYIDGRSDIYGDGPIREYADAVMLRTDPQLLLDRYAIDYVLFPLGQPLTEWLDDAAGWQRVYTDELAAVWIRSDD